MAVAHVVGGLSLDQGRLFRSHLLECPSCRARVGELRAIAHDLADVERDERRLRLAKRTETKAHESEDEPVVSTPRLSGRATLLTAAALIVLMALSTWNFVLRGRLQQSEEMMRQLRQSVGVLQDGDEWSTPTDPSSSDINGKVSTIDQQMVIMVDGLAERDYGIYLLNADNGTVHSAWVEATNGMVYEYVVEPTAVDSADHVLVMRTDELTPDPSGTTVFEASRSTGNADVDTQPVVETAP